MENKNIYSEFRLMELSNQYQFYSRHVKKMPVSSYSDPSRSYAITPLRYSSQGNGQYHSC